MTSFIKLLKSKHVIASAIALALVSFVSYIASAIALALVSSVSYADTGNEKSFKRIATFPVFLNSNIENETVAEIVTASEDGNTLIYTDGKMDAIGFVNIENAAEPKPAGIIYVGGEPTSVAVKGSYALAAVNTSENFIDVSGLLIIIDFKTRDIVRTIPLGGQPDSIAVSPDGKYAAVAIENERDEDFQDGEIDPAQLPAGKLIIVDTVGGVESWATRTVELTGLEGMLYADDPEPEYVDINKSNIATITLQENNHIVLVDLKKGRIKNHFSAGTQDLDNIDINNDKQITLSSSLTNVPREPDGVSWVNNGIFATADEGDLNGGSRGFTLFNKAGNVVYESAESVEHTIVRHGHYPDNRSGKKGNEPENVEIGKFEGTNYLFVGSERASVALVYDVENVEKPVLKQVLPTAVKPEGLLAISGRNLFVTAGENDDRGDKIRSALSIYKYDDHEMTYPTVISANNDNDLPISWGALSGLAADPVDADMLYTVHDSFYDQARIYKMDISEKPAILTEEIILKDKNGSTVNIDQEGIAIRKSGGFWIASEGKGDKKNLLLGVATNGNIEQVIELPELTNDRQLKHGFEGVTSTGTANSEVLYVAFQREWTDDPEGLARIGRYDVNSGEWSFFYYPLDVPESANGGWVGLSEITALDDETFILIERDNQANADAAIKRIYQFSVTGLIATADSTEPDFPLLEKTLIRDLMKDLAATKGLTLEKIEGMTISANGDLYIVNDNDGVDDSNGETQLLKLELNN